MPVIDQGTGEVRQAQIFVAVLGASSYTYVEATWTQNLTDWTGAHVRCFEFLGGVPEVVVPDNLKSGVSAPNYYDPELNPTYREMAGWNAQRFLDWAARIGPHTQAAIEHVLSGRAHPLQGYRTALGILRLAKAYGPERLEAACDRAFCIHAVTWRSINSILKNSLDRQTPKTTQASLPLDHANVRGADYYH